MSKAVGRNAELGDCCAKAFGADFRADIPSHLTMLGWAHLSTPLQRVEVQEKMQRS